MHVCTYICPNVSVVGFGSKLTYLAFLTCFAFSIAQTLQITSNSANFQQFDSSNLANYQHNWAFASTSLANCQHNWALVGTDLANYQHNWAFAGTDLANYQHNWAFASTDLANCQHN